MECGKGTLKFELGEIYYLLDKPLASIIVKNKIICPKCKKDISDEKCMVKQNYLLMKFITANISLDCGGIPPHLKGAYPLRKKDYEIIKSQTK